MEYKKIYVVLLVVFLISVFSGVTFSFWQWKSAENTEVVFDIQSGESCATVNGGGNITSSEITLAPASCTNSKFAIKREINITPVITEGNLTVMDLWLTVNTLGSGLSNSQNFKYVLTTSDSSCTDGVIASGNFNGKIVGDTVPLLNEKSYTTETVDTYYLYVWLDSAETSTSTMYQSFDLSIGGTCSYSEILDFNVTLNANGGAISSVSYTTSGEHTYSIPYDANYHLEVWGAQGGGGVVSGSTTYDGGYGGYSVGNVFFNENDILYINVGGQGVTSGNSSAAGGYNGGGSSQSNNAGGGRGSGGGATHIALDSGLLSTFDNKREQLLIVAGGGGGGGYYNASQIGHGGHAGGYQGSTGTGSNGTPGTGGTQSVGGTGTASGSFGLGANAIKTYQNNSYGGPGGGGGFYGGGAAYNNSGGGGGSGYIGNSLLTNKAMYCYNCAPDSNASTLTYSVGQAYDVATSNYAKSGDGAAKISLLSMTKSVTFGLPYGELPVPVKEEYNFIGWNTASDGSGLYVSSDSLYTLKNDSNLYAIWFQGLPGDVNMDGVVNNSDETLLTTYVSNPSGTSLSPEARSNADVNSDGSLDNDDIEVLQVYFEGGISALPYSGEIYTISYNMNGGTGTIPNQRKGEGTTITLSSTIPTITSELVFKGWATSADATSATYQAGGTYNSNASVTLYAVWKEPAINPIASYCCGTSSQCSGEYDLKYIVTSGYGSSCTVHDDGSGNWRVKFLKSGTLTVATDTEIDVFLVGGGGGGGATSSDRKGGGGGGGYTKTVKNKSVSANTSHVITIGAGGAGGDDYTTDTGSNGGQTSAFNENVNGGSGGNGSNGGNGGSGGGGGGYAEISSGAGGSYGNNGTASTGSAGSGQRTTTCEFGEGTTSGCTKGYSYAYAGGGNGGVRGGGSTGGGAGVANTGGGGGGGKDADGYPGGSGGSGIVVIRNARNS